LPKQLLKLIAALGIAPARHCVGRKRRTLTKKRTLNDDTIATRRGIGKYPSDPNKKTTNKRLELTSLRSAA
jgi:hypothetical protein